MSSDSDHDEESILLEIEETLIKCRKDDLIQNSDYFKAMLEGNFVESEQDKIKIEVNIIFNCPRSLYIA